MMPSIAEGSKEFLAVALPALASPSQRQDMEMSYYAGAEQVLRIVWGIGEKSISKQTAGEILKRMRQECLEYAERKFGQAKTEKMIRDLLAARKLS